MASYPINVRVLSKHGWRRMLSHAIAVGAGAVLATTFLYHAGLRGNPMTVPLVQVAASDFDRALRTAMVRMGFEMCITPSGDADRDFARAMIPHHQGAIEMARLELLYGRDDRLRRLAQGIVIEQSQEIALMRSTIDTGATRPATFVKR